MEPFAEAEIVRVKARIWFSAIDRALLGLLESIEAAPSGNGIPTRDVLERLREHVIEIRAMAERGLTECPPFRGPGGAARTRLSGEVRALNEEKMNGRELGGENGSDALLRAAGRDVG